MNIPSSSKMLAVAAAFGLALAFSSESSFAAQKGGKAVSESIQTSSSAPRSGGINRISLGLTTIGTFPGTAGTGLSALLDFGEGNTLQGIFSIGYVSGFSTGIGAIFRHDIKTSGDSGFHVGGGLTAGLGSSTSTTIVGFTVTTGTSLSFGLLGLGVGGFHVAIPGTSGNLVASFDAALGLGFTAGGGTAAFYTNLAALSSALGLSLHYAL